MRTVLHPTRIVALGFLFAILAGTALLMLPVARAEAGGTPWLVASFTAVSAVCVTGLVVVDTGTYWSGFGQVVILGLFQIGGFGMMTAATLLGLMVNRSLAESRVREHFGITVLPLRHARDEHRARRPAHRVRPDEEGGALRGAGGRAVSAVVTSARALAGTCCASCDGSGGAAEIVEARSNSWKPPRCTTR
jgi:hypothetical protein